MKNQDQIVKLIEGAAEQLKAAKQECGKDERLKYANSYMLGAFSVVESSLTHLLDFLNSLTKHEAAAKKRSATEPELEG